MKHLVKYRNQATEPNYDILQMFTNIASQSQNENSLSYCSMRNKRYVTYGGNNYGLISIQRACLMTGSNFVKFLVKNNLVAVII